MVRVPTYITTEDISIKNGQYGHDSKILPKGSFVKPLHYDYVPKHVKENKTWAFFDKKTDVFAYTHFGIIAIPKNYIREVV